MPGYRPSLQPWFSHNLIGYSSGGNIPSQISPPMASRGRSVRRKTPCESRLRLTREAEETAGGQDGRWASTLRVEDWEESNKRELHKFWKRLQNAKRAGRWVHATLRVAVPVCSKAFLACLGMPACCQAHACTHTSPHSGNGR